MADLMIKTFENKIFPFIEGMTILDSAIDNGINFAYSCKTGRCGICKTTLIKGEIEEIRNQTALIGGTNKEFLSCCCIPKTDITIDAKDLSVLRDIKKVLVPAKINTLELLSKDIIKIDLRLPPVNSLNFIEGQYIDLIGPNGIKRSYSIASKKDSDLISLIIKRVDKGVFSEYLFNKAKANDLLRIEGPKGTFFVRDLSKHLIFLATGTGIAPIISILESIDSNENYKQNRNITLIWGNRDPENFFWEPDFVNIQIDFVSLISQVNNNWNQGFGYVQDFLFQSVKNINDSDIYAAGSNDMINDLRTRLEVSKFDLQNFYSDAFLSTNNYGV